MQAGVERHLRVEHRGVDEELLEEQLQLVALVHVIHEDQTLALHTDCTEGYKYLFRGWGIV